MVRSCVDLCSGKADEFVSGLDTKGDHLIGSEAYTYNELSQSLDIL